MRETIIYRHHPQDGTEDCLIQLTLEYAEENGQWVGVCIELNTSAYSATLDGARGDLRDAILLQLSETEKLGFVWDYLRDNHVAAHQVAAVTTPGFSLVG